MEHGKPLILPHKSECSEPNHLQQADFLLNMRPASPSIRKGHNFNRSYSVIEVHASYFKSATRGTFLLQRFRPTIIRLPLTSENIKAYTAELHI